MFNIKDIIDFSKKPNIYKPGTAVMWTDPYISKKLLDVHLNPDLDLASRKKKTIESTVEWIVKKAAKSNLNILDLGCGPGLYSQLLVQKGHQVNGVDFSKNSINYATKKAKEKNLEIEYRCQNYLKLEDENKFDLVILIFTDFGVLAPDDRTTLLSNIHRALKPGGCFLFDVLNDSHFDQHLNDKTWEIAENGFWRDKPYLHLSDTYSYPEDKVILSQHCVIDEDDFEIYRFWTHFFSDQKLKSLLLKSGFKTPKIYNDIIPKSEVHNHSDVSFCVTKKG